MKSVGISIKAELRQALDALSRTDTLEQEIPLSKKDGIP